MTDDEKQLFVNDKTMLAGALEVARDWFDVYGLEILGKSGQHHDLALTCKILVANIEDLQMAFDNVFGALANRDQDVERLEALEKRLWHYAYHHSTCGNGVSDPTICTCGFSAFVIEVNAAKKEN